MNRAARTLFLSLILVIVAISLLNLFGPNNGLMGSSPKELDYTSLVKELKAGNVEKGEWQLSRISGTLKDGTKYYTNVNSEGKEQISREFVDNGAQLRFLDPPISSSFLSIISMIAFPLMILAMLYFLVLRPAQMGGNQAMNFGRSRARRVGESGTKVTFEDVAGIEEAKEELFEIVDFLKNTKKYTALGAKIPRGILLVGPPGVGKTYLARAIAGEAGVPFFHISGSDFVEMFVGVGAARVRDLFETAKAHRPSLIFIDEIDAVGRQRGAGLGGGHDEREQTLNQLLVEMDGFDPNSGVIMIAATNRPDVLDPALLRPGRFDRQVVVDAPDARGREAILRIHAKGKPLAHDVDLEVIARRTPGLTGADLANALNEAALLAARNNRTKIEQHDIDEAIDRVNVGPQRKSFKMDKDERVVTAYHESGHAIVGEMLAGCDPIHKVTILPRGMALGITWSVPEDDKMLKNKQELEDLIAMALGGRVAEEVIYGTVWTGSGSDLDKVTRIARAMVCEYGMSDKLGALTLGRRSHNPFLGRDVYEDRNYSEEIARMIDEEVREIVDRAHERAKTILTTNRDKLESLVANLLERETLNRDEFLKVLAGEPIPDRPPVIAEAAAEPAREDEKPTKPIQRLEPGTGTV
ncbi:MAG: ATP-dependent zinc metalloprotease FtsH [Fimbriimonadales bacterium]